MISNTPSEQDTVSNLVLGINIPDSLVRKKAEAELAMKGHGVPSSKLEDWKYTAIKFNVSATEHLPSPAEVSAVLSLAAKSTIPGLDSARFVVLNGVVVETPKALPVGVKASSISTGYRSSESAAIDGLVRFDQLARKHYPNFDYINTIHALDGLAFTIEKDAIVETPIEILFIGTGSSISAGRVLIEVEDNAKAVFVERHLSLGDGNYYSIPVIEVFCGKHSNLALIKIQEESTTTHVAGTLLQQRDGSIFHSTVVSLGGQLVRNEILPDLNGSKCECYLNGLTVLADSQHVDNSTVIQHIQPDSFSREHYKGIYGGSSTGVFSGTIHVHSEAQKTNAIQSNQSLLLSPDAQIKTRPQLKIYADDVKCTHGATIGEMDKDALFYLRSRGIPKFEAKRLLIQAFAGEVVEMLPLQPLRDYVMAGAIAKLSQQA
jgi:Fe-S cluster assembly protein SufD